MEYFWCLLPKGYPFAPPVSPASAASPTSVASPAPSMYKSESRADKLLTLPASKADCFEPPPFVPHKDDHTSLNQLESPRSHLQPHDGSHIYIRRSTSTLHNPTNTRSRSDPVTPADFTVPVNRETPRRRSSVPSGILRRSSKATETTHPSTPCTPSVHFLLEEDEVSLNPQNPVANSAAQSSHEDYNSLVDRDDIAPEETTNSARATWHTRTSSPVNSMDMFRDIPWEPASESFSTASLPVKSSTTPQEIRLRRPTGETPNRTPRQSLVYSKSFRSFFIPQAIHNDDIMADLEHEFGMKRDAAENATTRAYIHNFLPGDPEISSELQDDGRRKLSRTTQIIQTRDSVYEIVWEDSILADVPQEEDRYSQIPSSIHSTSSPALQVETSSDLVKARKLEHIETKLAAWSWHSEAHAEDSNSRQLLHDPTERASTRYDKDEIRYQAVEEAQIMPQDAKSDLDVQLANSFDDIRKRTCDDITDLTSLRRSPVSPAPGQSPPPQSNARSSSPRSAINAKTRRELLGNRKASDMLGDRDHFGSHRDSLILAHKRIFHEAMQDAGIEPAHVVDPHIQQLRRSTWTKESTA